MNKILAFVIPIALIVGIALGVGALLGAATSPKLTPEQAYSQAAKGNVDLFQLDDLMTVVAQTDTFIGAVDHNGIRDEADGSVSAIVVLFYIEPIGTDKDGTQWMDIVGRVSFKCHAEQIKVRSIYAISKDGKIKQVQGSDPGYIDPVPGSALDGAGKYVCNAQHPIVTQEQRKL